MVDVFPPRANAVTCTAKDVRQEIGNTVARELIDGEGDDDDRVWEMLCEHYIHMPAMNNRASQGIMRPVLPVDRMVSPVVVSSDERGDNARDELREHRRCGNRAGIGLGSIGTDKRTSWQ
jgi:hypothetical protein